MTRVRLSALLDRANVPPLLTLLTDICSAPLAASELANDAHGRVGAERVSPSGRSPPVGRGPRDLGIWLRDGREFLIAGTGGAHTGGEAKAGCALAFELEDDDLAGVDDAEATSLVCGRQQSDG